MILGSLRGERELIIERRDAQLLGGRRAFRFRGIAGAEWASSSQTAGL